MTFFFETYGCQMNSAESAALALVCKERGWSEAEDTQSADLILLNTCSVRLTAEKRTLGRIAHYAGLKKKNKQGVSRNFTLVIAGCMAQRLGENLKDKFPQIDYVMGTFARSNFPLILEAAEKNIKANININEKAVFSFSSSHYEEGHFRSFIPIMHGCNNFCSYCIVPYVRGREVSRDPQNITEEIRLVAQRGVREITLLGQNVNTYCWERKQGLQQEIANSSKINFASLLKIIASEAEKSGIKWIRFLSANPGDFSFETIDVMAHNKIFCRHLHLPVQHGSDKVLKAMNRGYTSQVFLKLVKEIRCAMPDITLSTDILVGFPGETEDDVKMTLDLMEEVKFLYSYMYHFNPREGTAAFDLPDRIGDAVKRERLSRVISLQKKHTNELLKSRIGSTETVLIEGISRKNADELITRTEKDEMAAVPGPKSLIGSFGKVVLSSLKGNTFRAKEILPCPGV
ncbi:MAG: tRNA (N6-isopentenyl adenosine(37)-C2)-methylthiotransferase MiaB [Treponema sp.]|nr:tRNA (N6-isopentenyl adenosine(37)-C2)-methylthiotransferase MiaB [Treponema sp.]MCL2252445.1 tRNA (N6-isopentenyl adenosine(37)-C2)-methylthiotransferase MiaB [Treponema sp.]